MSKNNSKNISSEEIPNDTSEENYPLHLMEPITSIKTEEYMVTNFFVKSILQKFREINFAKKKKSQFLCIRDFLYVSIS